MQHSEITFMKSKQYSWTKIYVAWGRNSKEHWRGLQEVLPGVKNFGMAAAGDEISSCHREPLPGAYPLIVARGRTEYGATVDSCDWGKPCNSVLHCGRHPRGTQHRIMLGESRSETSL